jgi:hypothetical protein
MAARPYKNPSQIGSRKAPKIKREWLQFSSNQPTRAGLNTYLLVDPANSKRKKSDCTVMWVVGLGRDERHVILDVLRDKLNLTERCDRLFDLVDQWRPILVGYEEYGMQG